MTRPAYPSLTTTERSATANLAVDTRGDCQGRSPARETRAVLNRAEEDLRNATIVAPISGVILSRDRDVGDAVSSILTMGSGAKLHHDDWAPFRGLREGKAELKAIGKIYIGQPARISVESFKDQEIRRQSHHDLAHGRRKGQRHDF